MLFPEQSLSVEIFIAHLGHFIIEVDDEHLFLVKVHEYWHLEETIVFEGGRTAVS